MWLWMWCGVGNPGIRFDTEASSMRGLNVRAILFDLRAADPADVFDPMVCRLGISSACYALSAVHGRTTYQGIVDDGGLSRWTDQHICRGPAVAACRRAMPQQRDPRVLVGLARVVDDSEAR